MGGDAAPAAAVYMFMRRAPQQAPFLHSEYQPDHTEALAASLRTG